MLVGAAVYLWPNLQGSIPKFAIKKPKLSLLLEHMTVIWYSGCDTMLPSTHFEKYKPRPWCWNSLILFCAILSRHHSEVALTLIEERFFFIFQFFFLFIAIRAFIFELNLSVSSIRCQKKKKRKDEKKKGSWDFRPKSKVSVTR